MNKILTERKAGALLWRTPFAASILAGVIASWRRSKASQSAYSSSYTNAENAALFIIYENLAPEQIRTYRISQLGLGRRIDKCQLVSGVGSHDIPCGEYKWQIIFIAFVHDSKFCVSVEPRFFWCQLSLSPIACSVCFINSIGIGSDSYCRAYA